MYDIQTLEKLLKKYILDQDIPKKVSPKPKKPYKKKIQKLTKRKTKS